MVWIALGADGTKSSAQKFISDEHIAKLRAATSSETGDAILLFADARALALAVAGKMRNVVGERCGLRDPNTFAFCWVLDFPYLEIDEETGQGGAVASPVHVAGRGSVAIHRHRPAEDARAALRHGAQRLGARLGIDPYPQARAAAQDLRDAGYDRASRSRTASGSSCGRWSTGRPRTAAWRWASIGL